jgi:HK97 gp10 family phage protein
MSKSKIEGFGEWSSWIAKLPDEALNDAKDYINRTALKVESDAKWRCPVDTGRLEASITTEMNMGPRGLQAEVGTNVDYASAVEFGTSTQVAQPYLIPAFNKNTAKFKDELREIIERELK